MTADLANPVALTPDLRQLTLTTVGAPPAVGEAGCCGGARGG